MPHENGKTELPPHDAGRAGTGPAEVEDHAATQGQWGTNEALARDRGAQDTPDHAPHAKLLRMANQIATFFVSQKGEDGPGGVATHINKFWDPRMRRALFAYVDGGGGDLHHLVLKAMPLMRRPHADPDTAAGTGETAEAGAPGGKGTAAGEAKSETDFPEHPERG